MRKIVGRRPFLFAALGFSLSACGLQTGSTPAVDTETVIAAKQTHHLDALPARDFTATDSGELVGDSFASTWRTGNTNGHLRFIGELMVEAYAVQRERHFEFDRAGTLQHYVEHTSSTLQRDLDRGSTLIGIIELEFAGGEAVYRARHAGGTPRSIRQWEVDRVLARADLLRRVVSRAQDRGATSSAGAFATTPPDATQSRR